MTATMRYALWTLLILRLALPITIPTEYSPIGNITQYITSQADTNNAVSDTDTPQQASSTQHAQDLRNQYTQPLSNASTGISDISSNTEPGQSSTATPSSGGASRPAFSLDQLLTYLAAVWLLGVMAFLSATGTHYIKLRRFIRLYRNQAIPQNIANLLYECSQTLGIRTPCRLIFSAGVSSPCMTGLVRPVLLLPQNLPETLTQDQLRHVILHELTHFKRKDYAMLLLMHLLRCVYWFNPMVHILFPVWRADMESACDHNVLQMLGYQNRKSYIFTLIHISAGANMPVHAFATGIADDKKSMKNRINGVYMPQKAPLRYRVLMGAIAAVLILSVFTVGCQPTPETPPVANKNSNALPAQAASNASNASAQPDVWSGYQNPWREQIDASKYTRVNIDAAFDVPTQQWKTAGVRSRLFTQAEVDRYVKYFLGEGAAMYATDYTQWTKSQIQEQLIDLKRNLPNIKSGADNGYTVEEAEQKIKELEAQYPNAPEEPVTNGVDTTLQYDKKDNCYVLDVEADIGNKSPAKIWAYSDNSQKPWSSSMFQFYNGGGYHAAAPELLEEVKKQTAKLPPLQLTEETAKQKALQVLEDLDIEGYDVVDILQSVKVKSDGSPSPEDVGALAYTVRLGRRIDDMIGSANDVRPYFEEEGEEMRPIWTDGQIGITLDDSGVCEFFWDSPGELTDEPMRDVQIISFEQLSDSLRKHYGYAFAARDAENDTALEQADMTPIYSDLNITDIELRLITLPKKDNIDEYMLTPAFIFRGSRAYYLDAERTQDDTPGGNTLPGGEVLAVINALDGSLCQPLY